jgi:Leucine Rich Repeat (LRR) protein
MSKEEQNRRTFNLGPLPRACANDGWRDTEVDWNLDLFIASEPRVVRFPKNKSLGDLYLLSTSALRPGYVLKRELGRAQGEVTVPAGKKLELVVDERAARNLKPVAKLEPRDLQALNLSSCQISDDDLMHLQGLTWLEALNLSCNKITGRGLIHLSEMKLLGRLELWGTDLTDDGLSYLPELPQLRELSLCLLLEITEAALVHLERLPALENLDLHSTYLDDRGLAQLKKLNRLRSLDLNYTKVSREGFHQLSAVLPRCRINWSWSRA